MKHSIKVTVLLLGMFLLAQLIGLWVIHVYSPEIRQVLNENNETVNITIYNMPYWTAPPEGTNPWSSFKLIVISIITAILLMIILMKINAELFLRAWFFVVVLIAMAITTNAFLIGIPYSSILAIILALPIAFFKVIKRNILVHNISELIIYPGIAAIFVPLVNIWTTILLLVLISIYDIYAVWHTGFMQKMAKYQIERLKVFAGFFVPYIAKKDMEKIAKYKKSELKKRKIKVNVAILGGGDVVFPTILAGSVLNVTGIISALIVVLGATLALALLFYFSEKGKFYPAMPFITAGCFIALILIYLFMLL